MKLFQIIEGRESAIALLTNVKGFKASFAIARFLDETKLISETYNQRRNDLIEKYGKVPDPNNPNEKQYTTKFIPSDSKEFELFKEEIEAILNEEIDINYTPLQYSYFNDENNIDGMGKYILILFPFFG